MAEKEERYISITQMVAKENIETEKYRVMPREEAINRMAKALFKVDNVLALDIEFEQLTKQKQLTYKVFAEAALNALLGDEK